MSYRKSPGAADEGIDIFIQDSSATDGDGLTGLAHNSAGLTCKYRRGLTGAYSTLTLASQTVTGAHTDGGFAEIGDGLYRLDLSDAIIADGVNEVTVILYGATNMAPVPIRIELRNDLEDISLTNTEVSRLDAAISSRSSHSAADVWTSGTRTLTAFGFSVTVGTNNDKTGYSLTQAFPSNFATLGINASGHVERVTLVDTTTANTDMRGTDGANTTAPDNAGISSNGTALSDIKGTGFVANTHSLKQILDDVTGLNGDAMRGTDGANTTTPPTAAAIRTEIDSNSTQLAKLGTPADDLSADIAAAKAVVDAILSDTGTDGVAISAATANQIADAWLDRVDGIEGGANSLTPRQAMRIIISAVSQILSGAATTTVRTRDTNDTKDRLVVTVDSDGNRTAVTMDAS